MLAAHDQPNLARQLDGLLVQSDEQAAGEQLLHRGPGRGQPQQPARLRSGAECRTRGQPVQQLPRPGGAGVDPLPDPIRVREGAAQRLDHRFPDGEPGRRLVGRAPGHRQAGRGQEPGELGLPVRRQAGSHGTAEPQRAHAEEVDDHPGNPQLVVVAPDEPEVTKPAHRLGHLRMPAEPCQLRQGHRPGKDRQRLQELAGARVETFQRAGHADPDLQAGRKHLEVRWGRHRQVRP